MKKVKKINTACCQEMHEFILDPRVPIAYLPHLREYGFFGNKNRAIFEPITYCPWCGTHLPTSVRDAYQNIIKHHYPQQKISLIHPRGISPELKNESWWRKRKL